MTDLPEKQAANNRLKRTGVPMGVGIALGVAIGAAAGSIAIGLAAGILVGGIGVALNRRRSLQK